MKSLAVTKIDGPPDKQSNRSRRWRSRGHAALQNAAAHAYSRRDGVARGSAGRNIYCQGLNEASLEMGGSEGQEERNKTHRKA